jgi:DNA polymerase-3 subunit gamma/tau
LETGLSKSLGQTIKISFVDADTDQSSPTLATERAEQAVANQERAKASIHNDPTVDAIKSAFDARVIESTIKPIK